MVFVHCKLVKRRNFVKQTGSPVGREDLKKEWYGWRGKLQGDDKMSAVLGIPRQGPESSEKKGQM